MVRIIKNYTNLFSVITSIFLIYLGLVFSSCGAGCDCNKTNLQIKYNGLNFVSGLPSCGCSLNNFYSIPNHWDLTVKNKWGTGGGFYYLPHNEIGVKYNR